MFCSCPLNRFPLFAPALLFTVLDNEFGRPPSPPFLCLGDGVGSLIPFQLCIHVAQVRDKALKIRTMYRQVEIKHEIGIDEKQLWWLCCAARRAQSLETHQGGGGALMFSTFLPPGFAFQQGFLFSVPNGLCAHVWSRCCVFRRVGNPWNSCVHARIRAGL